MKVISGALLLVLLCVCEAGTTEAGDSGLSTDHHGNQTSDEIAGVLFSALLAKLRALELRLTEAERQNAAKVAFSAGLAHHCPYGPFRNANNVVYNRVYANVGDAYNPHTGVFVAPVPGVYYFTFTASHQYGGQNVFVKMYKNSQIVFDNYGYNDHPGWEYVTNSIMLPLAQGDTVYMRLPKGFRLCGEWHNHFSGFLI